VQPNLSFDRGRWEFCHSREQASDLVMLLLACRRAASHRILRCTQHPYHSLAARQVDVGGTSVSAYSRAVLHLCNTTYPSPRQGHNAHMYRYSHSQQPEGATDQHVGMSYVLDCFHNVPSRGVHSALIATLLLCVLCWDVLRSDCFVRMPTCGSHSEWR
jgi:hypothetical protein